MSTPKPVSPAMNTQQQIAVLYPDGYIRIGFDALRARRFEHLLSGIDDSDHTPQATGATATTISGYTEWIVHQAPAITLGWDWQLIIAGRDLAYSRSGPCRSNLMLTATDDASLGIEQTEALLHVLIDTLPWQKTLEQALQARYC